MRVSALARTGVVLALLLCSPLFFVGCHKVSGKYQASKQDGDATTTITLDFKSSDKVDIIYQEKGAGMDTNVTKKLSYSVHGDKIMMDDSPGGFLTIGSDGSLTTSDGLTFKKQ